MLWRPIVLLAALPAAGLAGFANWTVVYQSATLQLMTVDYIVGGMSPLGQASEINLLNGTFRVDLLQRHLVAPHFGEPVQGPQLQVSLTPVKPGDNAAPQKQSGAHGGHTDVWQAMMESTAANASIVYMRFDHTDNAAGVPTIAPEQFAPEALPIPEPGSGWLLVSGALVVGVRRKGARFKSRAG